MNTENQSPTIGKIAGAVCAVIAERGYVRADARNDHFKYSYLSDEAVLGHVRGSMAKNGLMLIPCTVEHSTQSSIITTTTSYTLAHTSGEWMRVQVVAQGQDKADKGPYKAATGALKYALRQVFLIPTGDDPEKARAAEIESRKQALGVGPKGHTAYWRDSAKAVCTQLSNAGTSYQDVAAWCEHLGKGRPSGWPAERVAAMVAEVITANSGTRRKLDAWVAGQ